MSKDKAKIGKTRTLNVIRNNKVLDAKKFGLKIKPLISSKNKKNPLEG